MAFADELLDLSSDLVNLDGENPRQASLRRAVSTAYYALFHLLISEATLNWSQVEQRPALSRIFDHGRMKSASEEKRAELKRSFAASPGTIPESGTLVRLYEVVDIFVKAQQNRNDADYNNARNWTRTSVLEQIEEVAVAFANWNVIRAEPIAQRYLLSLLIGKSRRSE